MKKSLVILALPLLGGCSGYLMGESTTYEQDLLANYPIGSDAAALSARLDKKRFEDANAYLKTKTDAEGRAMTCKRHGLAYGFWAGGDRYVCYGETATGQIGSLEVFDIVAGL